MLREIRALGFEYAELSHGIRISLLPGIFEAVDAGEIKISSLHNFARCPWASIMRPPTSIGFHPRTGANGKTPGVTLSKRLKRPPASRPRLSCLHMGAIDMKEYTDRLLEMLQKGQKETPKYAALCEEVTEKRENKKQAFVEQSSEMLERLSRPGRAARAQARRRKPPGPGGNSLDSDMQLLLLEFNRPSVGYWHDCGHAQIKENLGFINHRMHLESMARACSASTCMMSFFPAATTPRRAAGRLISRP
jgi:hypothetical protein